MASYVSGFPAKSIASGAAAAVLVGLTAFGLVQIGTVFKRAIAHFTPELIKKNETLQGWHASVSKGLGTFFVSTNVFNETHDRDVVAKDKDGKEIIINNEKQYAAKAGDHKTPNTSLLVSGVALCLVALAGFKLLSYWNAGESPLNKVITYFTGLEVAPSNTHTVFNTVGNFKSKIF